MIEIKAADRENLNDIADEILKYTDGDWREQSDTWRLEQLRTLAQRIKSNPRGRNKPAEKGEMGF